MYHAGITSSKVDIDVLVGELQRAVLSSNAGGDKPVRVIVVAPGMSTARDIIAIIGARSDMAQAFHVSSSIACVDANYAYRGTAETVEDAVKQLLPGLSDQCRRGWTTHLIVFNAMRDRSRARVSPVAAALP